MPFPVELERLTATFGSATAFPAATDLKIRVKVTPDRHLVWQATGQRLIARPEISEAAPGMQGTIELVKPGQAGLTDGKGNIVTDFVYTVIVEYIEIDGTGDENVVATGSKIVGWHVGDPEPFDLDTAIPVGTTVGGVISLPDTWLRLVDGVVQDAQGNPVTIPGSGGGGGLSTYVNSDGDTVLVIAEGATDVSTYVNADGNPVLVIGA